jgi:glutamate-5-semialdehyde dehydrogenase
MSEVREKAIKAQAAVPQLNRLNTEQKNTALRVMADALITETDSIITANAEDLVRGREQGTPESMLDRLALNKERIAGIAEGLRQIADLPSVKYWRHSPVLTDCMLKNLECRLV